MPTEEEALGKRLYGGRCSSGGSFSSSQGASTSSAFCMKFPLKVASPSLEFLVKTLSAKERSSVDSGPELVTHSG